MSPSGQPAGQRALPLLVPASGAVLVGSFELRLGTRFDWHLHPVHQLAWAATGVLAVTTPEGTWVLPTNRALWLPAGIGHSTAAIGSAVMRSLYLDPAVCPPGWPARWSRPTVVAASPLLRELIPYLGQETLAPRARARAEAVVFDLLEPLPVTTLAVPGPRDPRTRAVAAALAADPADPRTLRGWGRQVGASERTLARLFRAETGLPFGRRRTQLRIQAALPLLAHGSAVSTVARRVGYESVSAFVAAFRAAVGVPPGQYFGRVTE
ncbi:AraC family transcriptional regulator [Crossiella sp. CA198]|uniref:AraC family transcriptional regulator n=1 Tax=Crossiella sp. CA198 TaxID=3455607 RepID=UPI003F8D7414